MSRPGESPQLMLTTAICVCQINPTARHEKQAAVAEQEGEGTQKEWCTENRSGREFWITSVATCL